MYLFSVRNIYVLFGSMESGVIFEEAQKKIFKKSTYLLVEWWRKETLVQLQSNFPTPNQSS